MRKVLRKRVLDFAAHHNFQSLAGLAVYSSSGRAYLQQAQQQDSHKFSEEFVAQSRIFTSALKVCRGPCNSK